MVEKKPMSPEQMRAFLEASAEIGFEGRNRKEIYNWVRETLIGQQYHIRGKADKGLVRSYIGKMTSLSRAQVTRLIEQYVETGNITQKMYRRRRFASVYSRADIELLAGVDEAHETLSGPATQKIDPVPGVSRVRECGVRAAVRISAPHIYNLRKSGTYRKRRVVHE